MNIEKYLNQEAQFQEYLGNDNDYNVEEYADEITIKCRIEGERKFIPDKDGALVVSTQSFWTLHPVKERDKLNGQYVKNVSYIYDFDGSLLYMEAYL
jgi:hypothetical protein